MEKVALTLKPTTEAEIPGPVAPKELKGVWEGPLKLTEAVTAPVVLRVESAKEAGPLRAVLEFPDQGRSSAISAISLAQGQVVLEVKWSGSNFTGKLDAEKGEIIGNWTQGRFNSPLTLRRKDKVN